MKEQVNITVEKVWMDHLRKWAILESEKRKYKISVNDLIREAVRDCYKIGEVQLEVSKHER